MNKIRIYVDNTEIGYNIITFSGGERHVQLDLETLPDMFKSGVSMYCKLFSSESIMDLLLLNNALKHHFKRFLFATLHIPYMPYARQDRVCADGQAFSMEVFASILGIMDIYAITTWDCHSQAGLDVFKNATKNSQNIKKITNIEPFEIIEQSPELLSMLSSASSVLICPDAGAVERCMKITDNLCPDIEMAYCHKNRDPSTGRILETVVNSGDLTGKTAIITDDICDGGYTFIKIAEKLKEKNVEKVILYVTHGLFSKGLGVFEGLIDEIFTSSSIMNADGVNYINYNKRMA